MAAQSRQRKFEDELKLEKAKLEQRVRYEKKLEESRSVSTPNRPNTTKLPKLMISKFNGNYDRCSSRKYSWPPSFYLIFFNDLPSQLSHSESTMFADDTTVLTKGSSIHDLNVKLNLVAQDLSTWTQQNRMVTNTLKTKTMLIHSPQQLKNTSDRSLSVTLNGNILAQVKQAKVLGLTLDKFLIWTKHILQLVFNNQ